MEKTIEDWKEYKENVVVELIKSSYKYSEVRARELVKDYELEIFEQYFIKGETPTDCAIEIGYGCG